MVAENRLFGHRDTSIARSQLKVAANSWISFLLNLLCSTGCRFSLPPLIQKTSCPSSYSLILTGAFFSRLQNFQSVAAFIYLTHGLPTLNAILLSIRFIAQEVDVKHLLRVLLGVLLLLSALNPLAALANESNSTFPSFPEGTYVEHEAIAFVIDASASGGLAPQSGSIIDNATPLMALSSQTTQEVAGSIIEDTQSLDGHMTPLSSSAPGSASGTLYLVRDESKTTPQLIQELEEDSRVIYAEPNWLVETDSLDRETALFEPLASQELQTLAAGDDLTMFQWGNNNDGTMGGAGSQGIDVSYSAWNTPTAPSANSVVVAVVDTGIDATNPDLANKMWNAGRTIPALVALGGDAYGLATIPNTSGHPDPSTIDNNGHGTHCAGIIAAEWNSEGVSGVSEQAQLMSLQHNNTLSSMVLCYQYLCVAVDSGINIKVVSNSWTLGNAQARSIDAFVREAGAKGVLSVFATGNDYTNIDHAGVTATTLKNNPYAVTVNAIDPTGLISTFSNYGKTTTDIMSPGSTILSTIPVNQANYIGEGDSTSVLYESFDSLSTGPSIAFDLSTPSALEAAKSFDGTHSLRLNYVYDPDASSPLQSAETIPVDLSSFAQAPMYLSLRHATAANCSSMGDFATAETVLQVMTVNGYEPVSSQGAFSAMGDAWGGYYVELPSDTDFANFSIKLEYVFGSMDRTGGISTFTPSSGDILVDSIAVGTEKVPFGYMQGTSMACPAVSGTAAVLAGSSTYGNASAEKLAAVVKGAAVYDSNYLEVCSTSGRVSVDGAVNPAPAITNVTDMDDQVVIDGYFFGANPSITMSGLPAAITSSAGDPEGKSTLTVTKPVNLPGGESEITVTKAAQSGRFFAQLAEIKSLDYYDEIGLPVFSELAQWGSWQLVGYNGNIYCLPQALSLNESDAVDSIWRFDPSTRTWTKIALPLASFAQGGLTGNVLNVSGATWREKLVLQVSNDSWSNSYWLYGADGSWEQLPINFDYTQAPYLATLASDGEGLYLLGGFNATSPIASKGIYRINEGEDSAELIGELQQNRLHPQVSYRGGAFVVSGGQDITHQFGGSRGIECLTWDNDQLASEEVDFSGLVTDTGQLAFASGPVQAGFMLAGPISTEGTCDTYLLNTNVSSAVGMSTLAANLNLAPYTKRAHSNSLLVPGATAYDGAFYVLAATSNAPYRTFSATAVGTVFQPGDLAQPVNPPAPAPSNPGSNGAHKLPATGDSAWLFVFVLLPCILGSALVVSGIRCSKRASR